MTRRRIRSYGRIFRYLNACLVIGAFVGMGLLGGVYVAVHKALPGTGNLATYRPRLATRIFSTERYPDGRETHTLLGRVYKEDREPEQFRNIPRNLKLATIAVEDRPFYRHRGLDPRGTLRAVWVNLRAGRIRQGGSTITQQLARTIWLTQERTWDRKLKELVLAIELERRFSKDEILEMYLNEVPYGHGAYGVRRAAKLYFGKEPAKLTLAEAALIAGLPRSPVAYSPYRHPDRARARRHQVLVAMREERYITADEFAAADKTMVQGSLAPLREQGITTFRAPHFTNYVVRLLCQTYSVRTVYEGGLDIYTTLDMRAQEIAEQELTRGVESLRRQRAIRSGLNGQGALACVEVKTGNVIAMVGGVGPYDKVQYNRAAPGSSPWGRQPGSSFKPYIWACALEHGYGPDSVFSGGPLSIPTGDGKTYTPKNYTPNQSGNYTLRNALAQSVNLVSVRIVRKLTVETVRAATAQMLNIPLDRIRPYYSLALGANELSPLEQAVGYCIFPNGGLRPTANFIRRVTTDRGELVSENEPQLVRVLSYDSAISMVRMLRNVITSGTGRRAAAVNYPAGGKTGTTNSGRDVWWVGFTPDLSAAVWVGNDDNSPMPRGSGGGFCAPIWASFMRRTMDAMGLQGEFPEGAGVRSAKRGDTTTSRRTDSSERSRTVSVCDETGGLATAYCPSTHEITLEAGERTPGRCRAHRSGGGGGADDDEETGSRSVTVTVCARSGQRAGPNCAQTTEKTFVAGRAPRGVCTSCGSSRPSGDRPAPEAPARPKPAAPKPTPPAGGADG